MNYLKDFLDIQIPRIQEYNIKYNINLKTVDKVLEHQILAHAVPRGFGTTTEIKEIFNPLTDLYVAIKMPMAKEFVKDTGGYFFSINCIDDCSLRGKPGMSDINRVFIDIGAGGVLRANHSKLINRTINLLHNNVSSDCVYIIT